MHFTKSLIALAACVLPLVTGAAIEKSELKIRNADATNTIENSYIVVGKDEVEHEAFYSEMSKFDVLSKRDSTFKGIGHKYSTKRFKGYQIETDPATLAEIAKSDKVAYIEKDGKVTAFDMVDREAVTWGLDRISHRNNTSKQLTRQYQYIYNPIAGDGATVYIIDSGIYTEHLEFEGRAIWGDNFVAGSKDEDEEGHGTHCAGTIGGATFGVANKAKLVAVKVLNAQGQGATSDVLAGMLWAADNATHSDSPLGTSIISMSLGGPYSESVNTIASHIISDGVAIIAAAGNDNADTSQVSPASLKEVITVGATDQLDNRAEFSNWGVPLDVFAPGVNITSAWMGSTTATHVLSGTSMACPHVAGLAAYFIGLDGPTMPAALADRIRKAATANIVTDPKGSPNLLANNDDGI